MGFSPGRGVNENPGIQVNQALNLGSRASGIGGRAGRSQHSRGVSTRAFGTKPAMGDLPRGAPTGAEGRLDRAAQPSASAAWAAANHLPGACQGTGRASPEAVRTRTGAVPSAATKTMSSLPVLTSWWTTSGGTINVELA